METCIVSDNYFRSVIGLPPVPYPEDQPSQSALEQTSPEDLMLLSQLEVDSVNRLLDQPTLIGAQSAPGITFSGTKTTTTSRSITGRPTPMRIVDQPLDKSESSAGQTLKSACYTSYF